jgi:hypothetical protein
MTRGECEMVVHGVCAMLDLHLDWVLLHVHVYNAFNYISHTTIFQELWSSISTLDQIFLFVQ